MIRSIQLCSLFFGILCCLGLAGCGGGSTGVPVKGTLTIGGQLADGVNLTLQPEDSKQSPVTGVVSKGSFDLAGAQGEKRAAPGKYKVVLGMGMSKEAEAAVKKGGKPKPATPIFPDKYLRGSSSDKEVVVSGQNLTIDIPGR
ncbi:MAG: hypothetical protein ACLQNE_38230 [Thermoguttaceae bacterium]